MWEWRPTNLTQLHQFCQEEWAIIPATDTVKSLIQVKQLKSHSTSTSQLDIAEKKVFF